MVGYTNKKDKGQRIWTIYKTNQVGKDKRDWLTYTKNDRTVDSVEWFKDGVWDVTSPHGNDKYRVTVENE